MVVSRGCVIFDLDGTLIDSRQDLADAVNLTRRDFALEPLPLETVVSFVGNGARKLIERALAGTNVNIEDASGALKRHYQETMLNHTSLYHGVKETVSWLVSEGWPLAVITNKPSVFCRGILRHFDLERHFVSIIGGDGGFPLKPEPDAALHVLAATCAEPSASWLVGDNYTDMATARRAGINRCFVRYGFGRLGDEAFDAAISSFDELKLILK